MQNQTDEASIPAYTAIRASTSGAVAIEYTLRETVASEHNKELRRLIDQEEKRLFGMSDMNINRQPILERIKTLTSQLDPEPHWTATPTFWVSVGSMLAASLSAYFAFLALHSQEQKHATVTPAPAQAAQHAPDNSSSSQNKLTPAAKASQGSK